MSNGVNGLFVFIEQGTNPTAGDGFDAPVNSLCTFDGTLYQKTGEAPTAWTPFGGGGGFEGGTVPDPTTFESDVTFEQNIIMDGGAVTAAGALNLSGGSGVTVQGVLNVEAALIAQGNLDVAGDTTISGPAFFENNVTIENGGDLSLANGSAATFGSSGATVNGPLTANTLSAGSGPEVLHAGAGSLGFFAAVGTGQVGAIADAAGGGTVDSEARTALNLLLAACRGYGLIAT